MSLFDEIAGTKPRSDGSWQYQREEVRADIEALCQTRMGGVPCDPGYGAVVVTALGASFPDVIERWSETLVASLRRYEPRLREPRVIPTFAEWPKRAVGVRIAGWLVVGNEAVPVQLTATLSLNGFWSVR
ncbi:GPW/gp25 family protein [Pendulispora albinea]|uniref:GPW/gp25 family protein n=1 Tax=Pendulispora albinea TaxID=2741071 RepID=A0ABZ2LP03_9BACT